MPAALAADGIDYAKFRRDMREEIRSNNYGVQT